MYLSTSSRRGIGIRCAIRTSVHVIRHGPMICGGAAADAERATVWTGMDVVDLRHGCVVCLLHKECELLLR